MTTPWPQKARRALQTAPGWGLLPLRLFLGVTFVYAGLQKISDPAFFKGVEVPGSLAFQLHSYASTSPVGFLLDLAAHAPWLVGVLVILAELAAGVGLLLGVFTRWAAALGAVLSLTFWLTVSWSVSPYFLAPDTMYLLGCTPFMLLGATDPLALDNRIRAKERTAAGARTLGAVALDFATVQRLCGKYDVGRCQARRGAACETGTCPVLLGQPLPAAVATDVSRRAFLQQVTAAGVAAGALVVLGGASAAYGHRGGASKLVAGAGDGGLTPAAGNGGTGLAAAAMPSTAAAGSSSSAASAVTRPEQGTIPQGTNAHATTTPSAAPAPGTAAPASTGTPSTAPSTSKVTVRTTTTTNPPTTTAAPLPAGTAIGAASSVPVGGAARFVNPNTGGTAYVVQPSSGVFRAYSATCPHAGCTVRAAGSQFACPCHGARFDLATGAVQQGPAQRGLSPIRIALGGDGQLYV